MQDLDSTSDLHNYKAFVLPNNSQLFSNRRPLPISKNKNSKNFYKKSSCTFIDIVCRQYLVCTYLHRPSAISGQPQRLLSVIIKNLLSKPSLEQQAWMMGKALHVFTPVALPYRKGKGSLSNWATRCSSCLIPPGSSSSFFPFVISSSSRWLLFCSLLSMKPWLK